jgi:sugar-specific transcriptional regulator TrmB
MNQYIQLFKKLGYSDRHAKIYLHILAHYEDSVMGIAKATSIPRTTIYTILSELKSEGLVSAFRKNKQQFWVAENPQAIRTSLEQKVFAFEQLAPMLREISGQGKKASSVRLFTGKEGVQAVWEDIIQTLETKQYPFVYAFSHQDLFTLFPKYFPRWLDRRRKTKTFAKLLLNEGYHQLTSDAGQEVRVVPKEYVFSGDITIYGNKVAMFIFDQKQPEALIIQSPLFTKMMQGLFDFAWDSVGSRAKV